MSKEKIFVIGDSHSCFWNGRDALDNEPSVFEGVEVFHVGPATAYNLIYCKSEDTFGSKIIKYLSQNKDNIGCIIFCFGEIDCRVHVVRIAIRENKRIIDVVQNFVERYLSFLRMIADRFGVPVLAWGPGPSSPPHNFIYHPLFPATGSIIERNYATLQFNRLLSQAANGTRPNGSQQLAASHHQRAGLMHRLTKRLISSRVDPAAGNDRKVAHFSIFDELVDSSGMTIEGSLFDGAHISSRWLGRAKSMLCDQLIRIEMPNLLDCLDYRWPIGETATTVNIAARSTYYPSSIFNEHAPKPFIGDPDGGFRFHTKKENKPHIVIDFGARYIVERVILYNRLDNFADRAASVMIECSGDGEAYTVVWAPPEYHFFGGNDGNPYEIKLADKRPYRYMRISLREEEYFHLDLVQIFVFTYDRS
jgi:hypothetical protein